MHRHFPGSDAPSRNTARQGFALAANVMLLTVAIMPLFPAAGAYAVTLFHDGFESGDLSDERWETAWTDWPYTVATACPPVDSYPGGEPYPQEGLFALYKEDTGWENPDRLLSTVAVDVPVTVAAEATLSFWYGVCSDDVGELEVQAVHSDGRVEMLPFSRRVTTPTHVEVAVTLAPGGTVQFVLYSNSGLMVDDFTLSATSRDPACSDGVDNDGDGNTDYPLDPGCDSLDDDTEDPDPSECGDGIDNDGDGNTDYPADPGCEGPSDPSEAEPLPACLGGWQALVLCAETGEAIAKYEVRDAAAGATHEVAGYLEAYRFSQPGMPTIVAPCVVLLQDGATVNPCEALGGEYAFRIATLVEAPVTEPAPLAGETLASVLVCRANLTATAYGLGVESAPGFALC